MLDKVSHELTSQVLTVVLAAQTLPELASAAGREPDVPTGQHLFPAAGSAPPG